MKKTIIALLKRYKLNLPPTKEQALGYGIALLVISILIVSSLNTYNKKNEFKTTHNPEKAKEVALTLKDEVGNLYVLPPEDPVVATVTDDSTLPKNSFYDQAENGDKILVFEKAGKLLLYRPSVKKIVDVALLDQPSAESKDTVVISGSAIQAENPQTPDQGVSGASSEASTSAKSGAIQPQTPNIILQQVE